jgi:hypothetical protein
LQAVSSNPSPTKNKTKKTKLNQQMKKNQKQAERVAQAVECLLCKRKALSSNPSITTTKQKLGCGN